MDERHWWIAGKIQESFKVGGFDNPTLIEDFMCKPETLDMINQFLHPGGPCRLFFYCENNRGDSVATLRGLRITGSLANLRDMMLEDLTILYFLRNNVDVAVDATRMERDIYCGELKGNAFDTLLSVLNEIYVPLIKSQKDWGQCLGDNHLVFMHNLDKIMSGISETSSGGHGAKHVMLKLPENVVGSDFKQHRLAALDPTLIGEYEDVVSDWVTTIEAILHDTSDERFMDPNAGPLSELERWRRRQRLLTSITEQLKSKECKAVVGILITAKSRLLKKWKTVDTGITDAMNETKDKVRYLESLKRHLEQLYTGATPESIMNTALPGLLHSIRQMDSVSRFHARQGFLGLLLTKVTNQIVLASKDYIQQCANATGGDSEDKLWSRVQEEIIEREENAEGSVAAAVPAGMPKPSLPLSRINTRLTLLQTRKGKASVGPEETLFARLRAILTLQTFYRDSLRSLRDSLGASHSLSHFNSMSSLGQAPSQGGRSKMSGTGGGGAQSSRGGQKTRSGRTAGSVVSASDQEGHGVSVADEETILWHLDAFCARIRQSIDVINTLAQFSKIVRSTIGLPRPRSEDLVYDEKEDQKHPGDTQKENLPALAMMGGDRDGDLEAITEDEEALLEREELRRANQQQGGGKRPEAPALDPLEGLAKRDVLLLKSFWPDNLRDDGPSVSDVVDNHVIKMTTTMTDHVTTKTMLDVESKDQERFEDIYSTFLRTVQELERFLAAYLNAVFMRKMRTNEALELLAKFTSIQQRPGVRMVIAEKFIESFSWYESDLEEIQMLYEKHKEEPPMLRNAPPVAGAINWSRQLLKRIEDPMKVFRENKAVTNLKDYGRVVKQYNSVATALVTFESLWFAHWKQTIEQARSGLRATLFVLHPVTGQILVNADERVLQLIHEARWLTRLGVQVPDTALSIMQQESRFKSYRDHLQLCITQFKQVCDNIPEALRRLFQPHIDSTLQHFQPGLNTLAWNSMNIDAFLHQIHTNTSHLQQLVSRVNDVISRKVENTIERIRNMMLFDYELAFSKQWPPQEFTSAMSQSVQGRSHDLHESILTIESGIKESAAILVAKKSRLGQSSREQVRGGREGGSHDKLSKEEERVASELITGMQGHYRDHIYEAILLATTRSLVTLAEASGCEGETVRAASALSSAPSSTHEGVSRSQSRAMSAVSDRSRPVSVLSMLSDMTWTSEKAEAITYLQFKVDVKFSIPNIIIEPPLGSVSNALTLLALSIVQVPQGVRWIGQNDLGAQFLHSLQQDNVIDDILAQLSSAMNDLDGTVKQHLFHFSMYDFLWKDDMYGNYYEFTQHDPGLAAINREVERLLKIEQKVKNIPDILPVGPVCLHTNPVRDALHGFAMAWKNQYASVLHEEAKRKLDTAVLYRSNVRQRLEVHVVSLDQLNSTLQLLEELRDMENKIDGVYLPIETMYDKLREFELRLPRKEVEEVEQLRERWQDLLQLAEEVRVLLLKERRENFEQELDKQVKGFVVEVIQFRNAFDAQGPAVPGITPAEAVTRLTDFQRRYSLYDAKRKTLDSVSKLFGIKCKPFPELSKTGEELELLGMLYGLFQKFLAFNDRFRDTLWAEVDLDAATKEVESYWDECLALPSKLKDWDAYTDMKGQIHEYREVFPLLHKLASKEIRNRHWLQVMAVTDRTFQLEAQIFRLAHLLDIGLIKNRKAIENICWSASRELELEVKLRMTEEEWTEQVLNFENYKKRGPMYLDKAFAERLLEQLEDAQALLAQMLTSKYIGPLREEAAGWAEKLKEVGEVLETWLEVQDLWQYLEAVFSHPETAKELPQEAKRFARIDKGWSKMMKRAYNTRNVLQCCYGEEVPKGVVLRHIHAELEVCFKSLVGYLDGKRRAFPRFYFVTDPVLLAILSRPTDLESVRPHLRSLFSALHDVRLEKVRLSDSKSDLSSQDGDRTRRSHSRADKSRAPSSMSPHFDLESPTKIDKRLTEIHQLDPNAKLMQDNAYLPSEVALEDAVTLEAGVVVSAEGESVRLSDKVALVEGVECWLRALSASTQASVKQLLARQLMDIVGGMICEDWALKYPTQICRQGLLFAWTHECEQGINELKYERKALQATSKRFGAITSRLPTILVRGAWRSLEEPMLPVHKYRLEALITHGLFLRDMVDNLANRRLKDNTDFEWRRCLRLYVHPDTQDRKVPVLYMLDQAFSYGCEFYGAEPLIGLTPLTDRCFLAMSQAVSSLQGAALCGTTAAGKTETVKGFAQTMGMFLVLYQCSPESYPVSLGKITQGLAMDGCWGCLDNVERLGTRALSTLIHHVMAVYTALRLRQEYTYIADGQEIYVGSNTALFMTQNTATKLPSAGTPLPAELRSLFRMVHMPKPDLTLVLKSKCSNLGLKAPSILATRLRLVTELAKDLLPDEVQHAFSIASLTGVLQKATNKRRFVREEKSMDRLEKLERRSVAEQDKDVSRSDSQTSQAPSQLPAQTQSSVVAATSQARVGFGQKKAVTPNPLSAVAKAEHIMVAGCLLDVLTPRLSQEHVGMLRSLVKDVFGGLPDTNAQSAHSRSYDVESALESTASENGWVSHKDWLAKCMQLYHVSQVHQGIIVAGPPCSGKSTVVQALVDALCVTPRAISRGSSRNGSRSHGELSETNHKLQRLYPLVVDELEQVFGYLNHNNDWVDGIFTSSWRKANRNQSTTWLVLDGPLNSGWADIFSSVLDQSRTLHLNNGDQLPMSPNVRLLFETDTLTDSSPAVVARTGIVYVDKSVVGWRPIAKAWLENRTQQEERVLQRAFNKTVDIISNFVVNECKPKMRLTEIGMFMTCLNMLSAMLSDNVEIGGELHIERLYLFCVMWTYGGLLDDKDRRGFNDLLATLSNALPDDDRDICFFDYYVDEAGEWDPWQSKVPEAVYTDHHNLLGEVFADTVDTVRVRLLMDFAHASGLNVLLVGPPGSGKTALVSDFIDTQGEAAQQQLTKKLVFSGASNASQLQTFIEANIFHRQGFVYGAKDGKRLQLFIDDLNLPVPDEHGVQRVNELLRRLLDDKVICTVNKPFEWHSVEGLSLLSTMSLSEYASVSDRNIHPRLMRHFAVFCLPEPGEKSLKSVVHSLLETSMTQGDHPGLDIELHNAISQASVRMLTAVKDVLRPSPMPGRTHYCFTLKAIVTAFQCLKKLVEEARADELMVVSLWKHEMERLLRDPVCRYADKMWFDETMNSTINEIWPESGGKLHKYFVTFPIDTKSYMRPVTSMSKKEAKVVLLPIESLKDVHNCLNTHLNRYNEEFGNTNLELHFSENVIAHVLKLHRIISYQHGGNFLLVGPIGCHLGTLCKLALHVADIPIHRIDTSKHNNFFDGLRSAVRITGAEGKKLTVIFTGRDLEEPLFLDAINSLLISGEYPHLFTNDELDGLLQALGPAMKREHPNMSGLDHLKFFVSRVKTNLHIMICLPPTHPILNIASSQYPGLLSGGQVIWMEYWSKESLLGEASYYLHKYGLTKDCDADLSESVVSCMANIHSYVLTDCRQTRWAGDTSEELTITQFKQHEKKRDVTKPNTQKYPNRPYAKVIMMENIKLRHRDQNVTSSSELFVGPTTYARFMDTFRAIYSAKAQHRTHHVSTLKKVITTLDQTRKDAKKMRENIKGISKEFDEARDKTAQLMRQLTHKATVLEKLKAKVGVANSLSAFLQLNELSDEEVEEDDLLKHEEPDEYDAEFDRMREENLKTRVVQAQEELKDASKRVDECRQKLAHSREQVLYWRSKVDRQCIERLKNFSNPPPLVANVMEMVFTLIGKKTVPRAAGDRDYPAKEDQSGRYSASSSSTKLTHKKTTFVFGGKQGAGADKLDRAAWKSMQITMTDSAKFVDMLHNVSWEDGLSEDVVYGVESYLAKGKDGQLGVTGEGSMLDNAAEKEFVARKRGLSPERTGITVANAKYSSEDGATLVQYTIAIVEYTRLCAPLRAALEKQNELTREIEENERIAREKDQQAVTKSKNKPEQPEEEDAGTGEEESLTDEDIPRLQAEVDSLQQQFDVAVEEKHSLELELTSMKERLKAASDMIDCMRQQEAGWREHVSEFANNDVLVANCMTAAAFLVYCAAMGADTRRRMGEFFLQICEHHGLPLPSRKLFRNLELVDFHATQLVVCELEAKQLPISPLMLENSMFVRQEDDIMAWPLLCDPTAHVIDWIQHYHSHAVAVVRYTDLRSQFDTCLSEGTPLLVTHVDVQQLVRDVRFRKVIHWRGRFVPGRAPFKMAVGDHEVECHPAFRLYLHTASLPHHVPGELAAYVSVVHFQLGRDDVCEELLSRFMRKEKQRLNDENTALLQERIENMHKMEELEAEIVRYLSSDVRLLNDLHTTKKLAELLKQYDEALESQERVEAGDDVMERGREAYKAIALRGAVCFDSAQYLREINPLYQMSYEQFLQIFDASIAHSDRASTKTVVERMTWSAYSSTVRMVGERDRPLYQLLLALEVEDSQGHVGPGEREFLISPSLGSVTMTALGFTQPPDSRFVTTKKPFDWLLDEAYHHLQILATHYEWFQDMFDRMPKDGRETQWRTLCEHDHAETQPLPDKMDDQLTGLQRMCVVRAVRSDKLMQLATLYVNNVLGKKYSGEQALNLSEVVKAAAPIVPVLLLYQSESATAERLLRELAGRRGLNLHTAAISGHDTQAEEKSARTAIKRAMAEGQWVLLQNVHNNMKLLLHLESMLMEAAAPPNAEFRCWLTAQADAQKLPTHLLQNCVTVMVDKPRTMKETLLRTFSWLDADILKHNSRVEWAPFLHNLCFLHGAVRLRARLGRGGCNNPADFMAIGNTQFQDALTVALSEFRDNLTCVGPDGVTLQRSISFSGMRFMLAEIIYGSLVSDTLDQQSLAAMVDYWISPNACKKDFELSRIKYRTPAMFFNPNARLTQLVQSLEALPNHQLECAEACNLHNSSETLLGNDQYVFTRLNKIYDAMPSSPSLTHRLFPRAPTPFEGPPISNISGTSNTLYVVGQGVFASSCHAAMRMRKETELWEICYSLLPKVPKAYNKEYVLDRVRKMNTNTRDGLTSFQLYIVKEMELMYRLVVEIRTTLQEIKKACDIAQLGDALSPDHLSAADDLHHNRIPLHWCHLAGDTAPPPSHSCAAWLQELQNRAQQFERILSLGREKMPAYWLGAFFYPRGLLALVKQDCYKAQAADRSGNFDQFVFQTEITARDKDHIRDPPAEGMFIFGIYMWGCAWEKTNGELLDSPPRGTCASMPVIHLTCWPQAEKPLLQDPVRAAELYPCPVYHSRLSQKESILELDLYHIGIPSARWALRGLSATVRPY